MVMQIESNLYQRQGKSITNFKHTLPAETSDLAQQILKSDYNFEFLLLILLFLGDYLCIYFVKMLKFQKDGKIIRKKIRHNECSFYSY
jgi:hypothetical protein